MSSIIVVAVDGSDLSLLAAGEGLSVLRPPHRVVVVTVGHAPDPALASDGSGHAGASMSESELDDRRAEAEHEARTILDHAVKELARELEGAEVSTQVLEGSPGRALCQFAEEVDATALVIGTRGRGGVKRTLLGTVSGHVTRHAVCPVVVVNPKAATD